MVKTKEVLLECVNREIASLVSELDKWKQRFTDNPFDGFEWSKDAFRAAARLKAANVIREQLKAANVIREIASEPKLELTDVTAKLNRVIHFMSANPEYSTSPQSNIVKQELLAAYARYVEEWFTEI